LSNGVFKDEMRMYPGASKMQQNSHKCQTAIPSLEQRKQ